METRKLGSHGPAFTVLGLGTWAFGGDGWAGSWGAQSRSESVATVRTAIELGVNWVDTAPAYGLGRAESIVGEAVRGLGAEVLIATKCGERIGPDGTYKSGRADGIVADCEASLRRLGRDVIDLYQLHHPPPDVPIEEAWQAMAQLQQDGKVRHLGLCNASVDQLRRCAEIRHVDSFQGSYSLLRRHKVAPEVFDFCRDRGIGMLPFGARGHGFLNSGFDRDQLAADDWRRQERWLDEIERGAAMARALAPLAESHSVTVGQLATAWLVGQSGVTSTPVGARSAGQAKENFGQPLIGHARELVDKAVAHLT